MRWWKRYEPLLEARPKDALVVVKELIADELAELYLAFPPAEQDVDWQDEALAARHRGRLHELPRLDVALVDVLTQIVAWDLGHEIEPIDHLWRNAGHRQAAPTAAHEAALKLLWRMVVEHLYARKDDTRGLLKGKDLIEIAEDARRRFAGRRLQNM